MNAAMSLDGDTKYSSGGRWLAPLWRFLSRFIRDANPTLNWTRDPSLELTLDLDNNTFSGIPFGVTYKECGQLGPCSNFTVLDCVASCDESSCEVNLGGEDGTRSYSFDYAPEGFGFGTDDQWNVDTFHIDFQRDPDRPDSTPYCGKVIWLGQTLVLAAIANFDALVRVFGAPAFDSAEHGIEYDSIYSRMLHYERSNGSWMIFLDMTGRTVSFHVSAHVWPASSEAGEAHKVE